MSALIVNNLCKAFGGLHVTNNVNLNVEPGERRLIIGPNGAGKTTLFALMSGFLKPDSGTVRFAGEDITGHEPHRNALRGMTRTFQIVKPFAAQTVRENIAVGVNPFRIKLAAIGLSAAFMGSAGAFYVQVFQYIDPAIAYGSLTSVEALVAAIVGGMGTLWGPVLGAVVLHVLADLTRNLFGELPGINMVIYGVVLVLIVIFLPRGIAGIGQSVRQLWASQGKRND